MTTPLDRDLADRLERLAAAVPVRSGQVDPVHASAVRARQQLRMRWLTPLVALLVGLLSFALLGGGNQPSPSDALSNDPNGPVVGADRDGDFGMTIRAGKHRYAPNEPIDVTAALTYFGQQARVEIDTDSTGPIQYGIRERVYGAIDAGQVSLLMCERTTLTRNAPLVEAFKKGGAFDGENPDADKLKAWLTDRQLRLPEGTWHLYAIAQAPCMGGDVAFSLRAEIELVVSDDPEATPGIPVATDWQDRPVYGGDDIGWMTFQVRSTHPSYHEGTPIDLDAWYSFGEGDPKALRPFVQQVEYRITQADRIATDVVAGGLPLDCTTTTMAPMEERHLGLHARDVLLIHATDWPASSEQALERGKLLLPPGHWRITVTARALFGPCDAPTDTWEVHASVEVDVVP